MGFVSSALLLLVVSSHFSWAQPAFSRVSQGHSTTLNHAKTSAVKGHFSDDYAPPLAGKHLVLSSPKSKTKQSNVLDQQKMRGSVEGKTDQSRTNNTQLLQTAGVLAQMGTWAAAIQAGTSVSAITALAAAADPDEAVTLEIHNYLCTALSLPSSYEYIHDGESGKSCPPTIQRGMREDCFYNDSWFWDGTAAMVKYTVSSSCFYVAWEGPESLVYPNKFGFACYNTVNCPAPSRSLYLQFMDYLHCSDCASFEFKAASAGMASCTTDEIEVKGTMGTADVTYIRVEVHLRDEPATDCSPE